MILQSLYQLYEDRLKHEETYNLPKLGWSVQNVTFRILLNQDGSLVDIQDARKTLTTITKSGKTKTKLVLRQILLPGECKPPGKGINPCSFWDNSAYLLGYKKPDKDSAKAEKEAIRSLEAFEATKEHYHKLATQITTSATQAICSFYTQHWTPDKAEKWKEKLDDFCATGFGVFRILPDLQDAHQDSIIKTWWKSQTVASSSSDDSNPQGHCLVTGKMAPIARVHEPAIKGVNGAAPGGAKLASFNKKPFESYSKDQSYNSSISEQAVFAYCNALNALLSGPESQRHRITIGDVTTIFWTEQKTNTESIFASFLKGEPLSDINTKSNIEEDQFTHRKLESFLNLLRRGGGAPLDELQDNPETKFYVLGLSGNVTRVVVRFWHISTIQEMVGRLSSHYNALKLDRRDNANHYDEPEFPATIRLLDQTARERKAISPLLGGQLIYAILNGTRYPMTLYQGVLNRLRANDPLNYLKAAIIKAVLIRNFNQIIEMSLNTERTEPAYLLGRLFAALEKTQEDALGKINAGIRERFYSSASATPGIVFPRILRTYQHHLSKLKGGLKVNRERLIQSIHAPLDIYPAHLNLEAQGLFAIGYYHQRQDFYTKKETTEYTEL